MRFLDTRRQRIAAAVLTLGVPGAWLLAGERRAADPSVVATVKRGEFRVVVTTAGELRARQFVQITVPTGGQQAGVYQIKISSIVPEGTVVKQGEVGAEVARQRGLLKAVQDFMAGFTIKAPSPGMVIYAKEWNGKKRTTGSQVNVWDPGVAQLPDLTHMESVTYVNEIDVRKVAVRQPVAITLDADPTKRLTGKVTSVANVGEQRPNSDAKVFEVKVEVEQSDSTLRPGMTTGNAIETLKVADALFVPLEALGSEGGLSFVYKQAGGRVVKEEVVTGPVNDDEVIIVRGLAADDRVLLSPPANPERLTLTRLPPAGASVATAPGDTGKQASNKD